MDLPEPYKYRFTVGENRVIHLSDGLEQVPCMPSLSSPVSHNTSWLANGTYLTYIDTKHMDGNEKSIVWIFSLVSNPEFHVLIPPGSLKYLWKVQISKNPTINGGFRQYK